MEAGCALNAQSKKDQIVAILRIILFSTEQKPKKLRLSLFYKRTRDAQRSKLTMATFLSLADHAVHTQTSIQHSVHFLPTVCRGTDIKGTVPIMHAVL